VKTEPAGGSLGPRLRQTLRLWWSIARLRLGAMAAAPALRALLRKARPRRQLAWLRGFRLFFGLSACAVTATAAIVISILSQGAPRLLHLGGTVPRADEIVILDPNRRDEFRLSPGTLYDRPVAAVQTGSERVLLRVRVEETLLTVRRDSQGLVVASMPSKEPGGNFIPRAVPQEAAQRLLADNGFCEKGAAWDAILQLKLPARRLPGGSNDVGRLLVFEKKTVTVRQDAGLPDVSVMLPEDLEAMGFSKTTWSYQGFYVLSSDPPMYQPVHLVLEQREQPGPPALVGLAYEFFRWDATQADVRRFGSPPREDGVALQAGQAPPMQPLRQWKEPANAWFYDEDGWVYYGQPLEPGVMTPLLIESFSVGPKSPLIKDETRYRLLVRAQSAPLDKTAIKQLWNSGEPINGIGTNVMSNDAGTLAMGVLKAAGKWKEPEEP